MGRTHLVDFVDQENGRFRFDDFQSLKNFPRHCADVGAPVAADLGFVMHAAQAHAHELTAGSSGNRAAQ